jgi:hypothetical protein
MSVLIKRSLLFLVFLLILSACEKQRFNDTNPRWVEELISEMEDDPYYQSSILSRYTWNEHFFYEIFNPISSCVYCEVFDYKGNRLNWEEYNLEDYLEHRTNQVIIWRGPSGNFVASASPS